MILHAIGCNYRTAPVEWRERLAFSPEKLAQASTDLASRLDAEVVILSTCNRVELYIGRPLMESVTPFRADQAAEYLGKVHDVRVADVRPLLYEHNHNEAVTHLCRVCASLDSLIVGEGQIAGQVKQAFEQAQKIGTTGPLFHLLFPHAMRAAKRIRTETGIAHGHISVSSVAVDYVRQVFDHFGDKTILVIGAGKMGRLTLKHLEELKPGRILVTNRSPEKALEVALACHGTAVPWEKLDDALASADIVLSTTGAPETVVTKARYDAAIRPKRKSGTLVILDIAIPRDFDPAIHDGDSVCVFNIDDLVRVREHTIAERAKHITAAEQIINYEVTRFQNEWNRRKSGPVIRQLRTEVDKVREEVMGPLLAKLNGKLTDAEKQHLEGAFRLFQNKLLHGPMAAIEEASREGHTGTLLETIKKLFRLT